MKADQERMPGWFFWLLLGAVLVAYLPAVRGGPLWDDPGHLTRPDLAGVGGLARIWFEPGATQQYYPLLHSAFWGEHRLWGDAMPGYHLANILWHSLSAWFLGLIMTRLAVPGARFAALLFALHPVCVESVAWISEQKNTLSTVLYLGSAIAYLSFDQGRKPSAYVGAAMLFAMALLTKTVTATLPAALLVVVWWRRGALNWRRDVLPLLPWIVAGLGAGLFTAHFERTHIGAQGDAFSLGLLERCLLAGRVVWFYAGKLLWPVDLAFIYPRWSIDAGVWWQWLFPVGLLVALVALAAWRVRSRGLLAVALLFVGSLVPALGFFDVYPFVFSFVADHFQYLAMLGPLALFGAGYARAAARWPTSAVRVVGACVVVVLMALTWRQAGTYRDVEALYRATLARNPDCWMAHNNLAIALTRDGRLGEAIGHLERAIAIRPSYAEAENNLGDALNQVGRSREAIPHLERALVLQPEYPDAHNNLGVALMALGRRTEAQVRFEAAVRARPAFALAHRNLGRALATGGSLELAAARFAEVVRLLPDSAESRMDLGFALLLLGRPSEATPHLQEAVRLQPGSAAMHNALGRSLAAEGHLLHALAQFDEALALDSSFREAAANATMARRGLGLDR